MHCGLKNTTLIPNGKFAELSSGLVVLVETIFHPTDLIPKRNVKRCAKNLTISTLALVQYLMIRQRYNLVGLRRKKIKEKKKKRKGNRRS